MASTKRPRVAPPAPRGGVPPRGAREAEERLAAYRRGEIKALSLEEVLAKYRVN